MATDTLSIKVDNSTEKNEELSNTEVSDNSSVNSNEVDSTVKKSNNKFLSAEKYQEYKELLNKHFPESIGCKPIKVLKIGIDKDILAQNIEGVTRTSLKCFLRGYCRSAGYKKRLKVGNDRHDLQGKVVAQITEQECEHLVRFKLSKN